MTTKEIYETIPEFKTYVDFCLENENNILKYNGKKLKTVDDVLNDCIVKNVAEYYISKERN